MRSADAVSAVERRWSARAAPAASASAAALAPPALPPQAGHPQQELFTPVATWRELARNEAVAAATAPPPSFTERPFEAPEGPAAKPPRYLRTDRDQISRRERRKALRWLTIHSDLKSQQSCSQTLAPGEHLTVGKRGDRAVFKHLVRCKRLDCPVCGPGAAEAEAADIALAITEHYARGGSVAFMTLTLKHKRRQALTTLLNGLSKAWTSCRTARAPRALWKAHTTGYIRKLEVTDGVNGWHPHLHLLVFLKPGVTHDQVGELAESLFSTWVSRLVKLKLGRPSREHGIDWKVLPLAAAHELLAQYVAKDAGRELAAAGTKEGRSGNRSTYELLLAAAIDGDVVAGLRYLEYEDAMRGLARVQWSTGLKDELLDPELEGSGDEEDQARGIAVFTDEAFFKLRWNERYDTGPGLSQVLDWAEVYNDDALTLDLLQRQCRKHGIPPPVAPSSP